MREHNDQSALFNNLLNSAQILLNGITVSTFDNTTVNTAKNSQKTGVHLVAKVQK